MAAMVGLAIYGYFTNRKATVIGFLAVGAVIFTVPQSRHVVLERFGGRQGGFTTGRMVLWNEAGEPLSILPFFGYGPGSFRRLVPDSVLTEIGDPGIKSWHSAPLEVLIESGPLALLGLLGLILASLGRAWKWYNEGRSRMALAISGALTALYLASLTTNIFRDFLLMSLLIILWAMIFGPRLEPGAGNV